jgi:hypothetical protein
MSPPRSASTTRRCTRPRALGPLIGGATYQALGIGGIYALIAASYLVCVWLAAGLSGGSARQPSAAPARFGLGFLLPPESSFSIAASRSSWA